MQGVWNYIAREGTKRPMWVGYQRELSDGNAISTSNLFRINSGVDHSFARLAVLSDRSSINLQLTTLLKKSETKGKFMGKEALKRPLTQAFRLLVLAGYTWMMTVFFVYRKQIYYYYPGFGPEPNWAMSRPNRVHTPVFPDRNYRVWKAVRAHNSLDHGHISVWSEVNSVWTVWS